MSVVVVGAGQAGLAVSQQLAIRGIDHVVLERSSVAQAWRDRWDSLTLVTPNWTLDLPGSPYGGDDPEGHVPRDAIVDYLEAYRRSWKLPIREGVEVHRLSVHNRAFVLATSAGDMRADRVVVCTGAFQRPHRPAHWTFPSDLPVRDAGDYRNPDSAPPGPALIVGAGQTAVQLADELRSSGREVYLACGRAPWAPRRLGSTDTVTWLHRAGFYEAPVTDLPPEARLMANPQVTGADGGRDLNYRTLQKQGVLLLGRLERIDGRTARFADDLADSVAFGDARWADVRQLLAQRLPQLGYKLPPMSEPEPFAPGNPPRELDLTTLGAVILATGYRPDYTWIDLNIFDAGGWPLTRDGAVDAAPGLYFCGVHFMRTRHSGFMFGVGRDAAVVAAAVARDDTARPRREAGASRPGSAAVRERIADSTATTPA